MEPPIVCDAITIVRVANDIDKPLVSYDVFSPVSRACMNRLQGDVIKFRILRIEGFTRDSPQGTRFIDDVLR